MNVKCLIVSNPNGGYEGIITSSASGTVLYRTGLVGCPEDANALMKGIIHSKWNVI